MLVSKKVLPLMQFVPSCLNYAAQVKALVEKRESLPFSAFVRFFVAHEMIDLLSKEGADGGLAACGQDSRFFEHLPAEAYRHILFRVWHRNLFQNHPCRTSNTEERSKQRSLGRS